MAAITDYGRQSRFATDPYYQVAFRNGAPIGTITLLPPAIRGSSDFIFVAKIRHQYRWDLVAYDTLRDVGLKWVILRHNAISDPLIGPLVGDRILIPTQQQVRYYLRQE